MRLKSIKEYTICMTRRNSRIIKSVHNCSTNGKDIAKLDSRTTNRYTEDAKVKEGDGSACLYSDHES